MVFVVAIRAVGFVVDEEGANFDGFGLDQRLHGGRGGLGLYRHARVGVDVGDVDRFEEPRQFGFGHLDVHDAGFRFAGSLLGERFVGMAFEFLAIEGFLVDLLVDVAFVFAADLLVV